jgi:peptide deformylase
MAKLPILHYPDPRLRNHALPVEQVDNGVRNLVDDMLDTMYNAPGIGLAATQVNVAKRVVVIDISTTKSEPLALINPEIVETEGPLVETEEGCLSVPDEYETVERSDRVRYRALDRDGVRIEAHAEGLLAVCIQHEIDHLDGKLFIDYVSRLKRGRIKKRAEKQQAAQ